MWCLRPSAAVQRVALEPGGAAAAPASVCCREHSTQKSGYGSVALLREALCFRVGSVTTAGCVQDLCLLTSPTASKPFLPCQRLTLPLVLNLCRVFEPTLLFCRLPAALLSLSWSLCHLFNAAQRGTGLRCLGLGGDSAVRWCGLRQPATDNPCACQYSCH